MIKNILWDFDGVILDSMKVRDWGFEEIFKKFSDEEVEKLLKYHRKNGGLSRYVKIRYFFEEIKKEIIDESTVLKYASNFSKLMKEKLVEEENLIKDSVRFIKNNYKAYNFHIVSGSDQEELRFLNSELGIDKYFISIHGSPTPKKQLVSDLMLSSDYKKEETCLIGDSINDYDAAINNGIKFYGYNNEDLISDKILIKSYIKSFEYFKI